MSIVDGASIVTVVVNKDHLILSTRSSLSRALLLNYVFIQHMNSLDELFHLSREEALPCEFVCIGCRASVLALIKDPTWQVLMEPCIRQKRSRSASG
jgi:hypothetical protein